MNIKDYYRNKTKSYISVAKCFFFGRPETTKHYLFECNRFKNLRQEMMQSISQLCEPTLNALLYGVTDLSDETNRQLFIIIQEYILRTKRFQ